VSNKTVKDGNYAHVHGALDENVKTTVPLGKLRLIERAAHLYIHFEAPERIIIYEFAAAICFETLGSAHRRKYNDNVFTEQRVRSIRPRAQ
jgi:hypothetical protein